MEIKINDYVRDHINGIGKVIKCYDNELEIVFKKARVKTSVSSYFEFELNKSSPRIIDLIEVGDYVNGQLVKHIAYFEGIEEPIKKLIFADEYHLIPTEVCEENEIKSIVTKEQFKQMEYKIGE